MHPALASAKLRSAARSTNALKAWRKRQMVKDKKSGALRSMRLTDVPEAFGYSTSTWNQWEQEVDSPDFRCPNSINMRRICNEITKGEIAPGDFFPPIEAVSASGG